MAVGADLDVGVDVDGDPRPACGVPQPRTRSRTPASDARVSDETRRPRRCLSHRIPRPAGPASPRWRVPRYRPCHAPARRSRMAARVKGLMQAFPLTVPMILRRAMSVGAGLTVASAGPLGVAANMARGRRAFPAAGGRARRPWASDRAAWSAPSPGTATVTSSSTWACPARDGRCTLPTSDSALRTSSTSSVMPATKSSSWMRPSPRALAPWRDRLTVRGFVVMEDGTDVHPAFAECPRYEELLASCRAHRARGRGRG